MYKSSTDRKFLEEQKFIALYAIFLTENPHLFDGKDLENDKKRKKKFLKSHKVKKGSHIWNFFMKD